MATNSTTEKTRENVGNFADKAKDAAHNLADKAKDATSQFADKAKNVADNVADKAKDTTANLTHQAQDLAKNAGKSADDATATVGHSIRSAADTVRSKGPHDGMLGSATSATASAMENTGRYLEEEKLSGMASDVTEMIRRNPLPALCIAAGVGFLLGRMMRS